MRPLIFGGALLVLTLLAGCQTPHTFAKPDASWNSMVGQLKHTSAERALVVDVVVQQRGAQEFQIDALKGGSFPIISVRQDATTSRAEGLLAHGKWQGSPANAPGSLRPWLALREAFVSPQQNPHGSPTSWRGRAIYNDGQLENLSLAFSQDAQRFVFQFNR